MSTLKQQIAAEARRLGFQHFGVAPPDPPAGFDRYERWLAAGYQAGMNWMATERSRFRRADPRRILPECQSVVVLGMHYHPQPAARKTAFKISPSRGKIASYAWGDDYHDILPDRLRALVAFIETQVGHPIPNRWYTDTGPILERELAQRGGLGWIGKNGCLIHPQAGSYFVIAEILLGLDLPADDPFPSDHCGNCTRCIDACPTGCILPDRTVDANRCISYLTIEEKGVIPSDLRPKLGSWVFGCDICQQVCPWNQRFAACAEETRFAPRPGVDQPILQDELALTPQAFNRKFKGSPIKRTKRRGYLRNVAVALGNTGTPADLPALEQALTDPEPLVRAHAAWAIGEIGGEQAQKILNARLRVEGDKMVLAELQAASQA